MNLPVSSIVMLILGIVLLTIAPKIVGFVLKVIGIALVVVGGLIYFFPFQLAPSLAHGSIWLYLVAGLPVISGLAILVVGSGMAKLAVRIAGILLIISAMAGLGVI